MMSSTNHASRTARTPAALPRSMRAMVLERPGEALKAVDLPLPVPQPGQILLRVEACGVCRTDLHLVDGELPDPVLPMVPGHEIVGRVAALSPGVQGIDPGLRIGVPWLGWTCGRCHYCRRHQENLCDHARFTGYQIHGGYAEYTVADARYCFPLDDALDAAEAAPLLCAGLIGYRAGDGGRRATHRPVRIRRCRAHHLPGRGVAGARGLCLHPPRGRRQPRLRPRPRRLLDRRLGRASAAAAGCSADLRPRRGTGAGRAANPVQGRHRRVRRHPHERHPVLSLRHPVGRTPHRVGRQSHPARRRRVPRPRRARAGAYRGDALRAGRRQPRPRPPAPGRTAGRCGADSLRQARTPPEVAPNRAISACRWLITV
ncbi:protein of unknown function [Thauera humireducens]|nr:protein of unknown function [Thauera humireducens]